ncbi:MAG: zinc-dependent alcohol dehydrogenase [Bacillota bacterium]
MKALILENYNELKYKKDIPDPTPGPEDLLIHVKACAICGSDVHGMDGSTGRRIPPLIMGHEAAGEVVAVGAMVRDFQPGERVTFDSTIYCGRCRYCRAGQINLCDHRRVLGVSCAEYRQNGAFAEYVVVPARTAFRLPEGLSFERAALVEPLAIALHAVNRARPHLNDTALVVGSGTIGLLIIELLRLSGCRRIIALDREKTRLESAKKLGATDTFLADDVDLLANIQQITDGLGIQVAFEAVGTGTAVENALAALRKGGSLVLIGNLMARIDFPLQQAVTKELSIFGSCASAGEYEAALDLMTRGAVDVDSLISVVAPLAEGPLWFRRLYEGAPELIKVVLVP